MDRYPLCEKAGLKIEEKHSPAYENHKFTTTSTDVISAADVERLLSRAPGVEGHWGVDGLWHNNPREKTHAARVVMIEPIKPDTVERMLEELSVRLNAFLEKRNE